MKRTTLADAIKEARRFIEKAEELDAALARKDSSINIYYGTLPRESGACRRASMDLTRKLADLRQGR